MEGTTAPPRTAGSKPKARGGGVAECMKDPVSPAKRGEPAAPVLRAAPEADALVDSKRVKAKAGLPAHTKEATFAFGAPTKWATTAKDAMRPPPQSPEAAEAEGLYKASHRRAEPGQQRVPAAWWEKAGVDPQTTVFGKPSSTSTRDSVAQVMNASAASQSSSSPARATGKK